MSAPVNLGAPASNVVIIDPGGAPAADNLGSPASNVVIIDPATGNAATFGAAFYATLAALATSSPPSSVNVIHVGQFDTNSAVSLARYIRVASNPNHAMSTQDSKGQWWVIYGDDVTLEAAGASANIATDVSTALQRVLTYCGVVTQSLLTLGPRDYLINTKATLSTSGKYISIKGRGKGISRFIVPATNTNGAFLIAYTDFYSMFDICDCSFIANGPGCGTGFAVTQAQQSRQLQRKATVQNVEVKGNNPATDYFSTCINLTGMARPLVEGVDTVGCWGPGITDDFTNGSLQYASAFGLVIDECYAPVVARCNFWSASTLVSCQSSVGGGNEPQGFWMEECILNGCKTGLLFTGTGTQRPLVYVGDTHVNYRDVGIDILGARLTHITGSGIYNVDTANDAAGGTAYDVRINNSLYTTMSGNRFYFPGNSSRVNVLIDGDTVGASDYVALSDNVYNATVISGVKITASVQQIVLCDEDFIGVFSGARIDDQSGRATITRRSATKANTRVIESQNTDANAAPTLELYRNKAAGSANSDALASLWWTANDAGLTRRECAAIQATCTDNTANAVSAKLDFFASIGGTVTQHLSLASNLATFSSRPQPNSDLGFSLGDPAARWNNLYVRFAFVGTGTTFWTSAAGSPNSVVTAPVGSLYTATDGAGGTTLYIKETGSGNTGWVNPAPLTSPALTGTPTAPTAAGGTNTTQVATTAFSLLNATASSQPGNPTAPNSTASYTMAGLAGSITPAKSGKILIIISGNVIDASNLVANVGIQFQISYSTGTAPTSNAALTGTQVGTIQSYSAAIAPAAAGDVRAPFCTTAVVTGLTVGTAYWIDLAQKAITTANQYSLQNVNISVIEI